MEEIVDFDKIQYDEGEGAESVIYEIVCQLVDEGQFEILNLSMASSQGEFSFDTMFLLLEQTSPYDHRLPARRGLFDRWLKYMFGDVL